MIFNKQTIRSTIFLLTFLLLQNSNIQAQGFSYVLIQGDKKTPIYTKVEGVMMPRYGKNYALLSRLAPGPLNLEILFQQNEYPPLQFNILVPEGGKRAFVLQQKDGQFQLFDVEQNFYLKSNNSIDDDHIPSVVRNTDIAKTATIEEPESNTVSPIEAVEAKTISVEKTTEPIIAVADTTLKTPIDSTSKPTFIEAIVFDNNTEKNEATTPDINLENQGTNNEGTQTLIIENSDCNGQISSLEFLRLSNIIYSKKTEDEKLGLIIESAKKNCFSTEQDEKLLEKLSTDIAKFSAIKSLYPKTTDQSNFGQLASQLTSEDWKEAFQNLIQNK